MATFHAEPRECGERVDDESAAITGVVIPVVGAVLLLDRTQTACVTRLSVPQVWAAPVS